VRDALATGPHNAIDQSEKGDIVARAADVRGGIEDDGAGSHTPVRSRADHRTTPVVDRLHLPFAAVAFSAVVSLMPGFFLFNAATGLVELVSIGPSAPAALLTSIATAPRQF
jgi:hypothetical protein